MIPEPGIELRIKVDEEPQWFIDLLADESNIVHRGFRDNMRVRKLNDVYFVIFPYATYELIDYYIYVRDQEGAQEHIRGDINSELQYERDQDMIRDAHEDAHDDREPDCDEW